MFQYRFETLVEIEVISINTKAVILFWNIPRKVSLHHQIIIIRGKSVELCLGNNDAPSR